MVITTLPPHVAMHLWGELVPFLQLAADESNEEFSTATLRNDVASGRVAVNTVTDENNQLKAVITFEKINFATGRTALHIQAAGGEDADEWINDVDELAIQYAKGLGCSAVYIIGRKGWERKLKHIGYNLVHTVVAKEI